MKNISFLVLTVALAIGLVSCGGKDNKSGGDSQVAYLYTDKPMAKVGNQTYQISPASYDLLQIAYRNSQMQQPPIQPVNIGDGLAFKANLTFSTQGQQGYPQQNPYTQPNQYPQQYPQQYPYSQQGGNILNITQAVFIR